MCTIIRPPGRGVALVWTEVSCHLRSCNKCLKRSVFLLSRLLVCSSLVRSFMSLQMLLARVKKVFVFPSLSRMLVLFFPTVESCSVVARALHILSDPYIICCTNKDLHSIVVKKELHMTNLLYSSSYSQTIDLY